jgi:hypothetical protein
MPALYEEDTASDEKDTHQMTSHNGLKPHQYYNPYPQITTQSTILILTPNTKDKEETWRRIQNGMNKQKYCYLKFFNDDEIEKMIDDGITLEETISRADLADLADYQETDRHIFTIIYDPMEQALIHLQTTEDYTITGEQYLTKYNLTALCRATTDDHIIGMQVKAPNHTMMPWTYKPKTPPRRPPSPHQPRNNLHDRFTKIEQGPNLDQTTKTPTTIAKENTDLQKKIDDITRENEIIKRGLDNIDSRQMISTDHRITHPPSWLTPPATPEREETPQPPTMEQEGEVKDIKPNEETDEEDEEEHQRNLKEVRA